MYPFCIGTKIVQVIDNPETGDQTLLDAIAKDRRL